MSSLYLVRHGQAGLRHDYDSLSATGRRQAELLGEYFAAQQIRFDAIYSGALARQQQTAEAARQTYGAAGHTAPEIITDPNWNEFDLDQVYRDYAPLMSADDADFRASYEDMRRQARDAGSSIHRAWLPCDVAVVRAWTEARYPCQGESWVEFQARVARALESLRGFGRGKSVAIFTSGTPIAVWVGMALGLANGRLMRLAAVIYNSAVTTLNLRGDDLRLFSFNGVPHLTSAELRTFR